MIIASAVISTGRRRVRPASIAAWITCTSGCSARYSFAKLTTRMEFDTPMPTAMIAPISDMTFRLVPVSVSIHKMPISAPGTAIMMMNGSVQDWNSITSSAYTRITARIRPSSRLVNDDCITSYWPRMLILAVFGKSFSARMALILARMSVTVLPRSRLSRLAAMSMTRCTV